MTKSSVRGAQCLRRMLQMAYKIDKTSKIITKMLCNG